MQLLDEEEGAIANLEALFDSIHLPKGQASIGRFGLSS
jgi:hypothetical protein